MRQALQRQYTGISGKIDNAQVAVYLGHRHRLRWSWWRRRHQGRARASHY